MNIFGWRKNLNISNQNPEFKVRYLGNVQTSVMKGDGCVDRATNIIWTNHKKHDQAGIDMKIELTGSGMKAYTQDQGLTEYLASRISYCIAHPNYPRLFLWVYRHEGRKSKMELRCHAVLCKSEAKAKAIAFQLCEKLKSALEEFKREKIHRQNSRLVLQKTNSVPRSGNLLPLRTQLLSTAKNFRPPPTRTNSANKLGAIWEDREREEPVDECSEVEIKEKERRKSKELHGHILKAKGSTNGHAGNHEPPSPSSSAGPNPLLLHKGREHHGILEALDLENPDGSGNNLVVPEETEEELFGSEIDLEFGNDFNELEEVGRDSAAFCVHSDNVDSDEESAESGFHDQEASFSDSEFAAEGRGEESSSFRVKRESIESVPGNAGEEGNEEEKVCAYPSPSDEDLSLNNKLSSSSPSALSSKTVIENTAL